MEDEKLKLEKEREEILEKERKEVITNVTCTRTKWQLSIEPKPLTVLSRTKYKIMQ